MTTFDIDEVRGFVADLDARMSRCENGEGMERDSLDASLICCAELCHDFLDRVKEWGREVFAGRVAFDPPVERLWLEEGDRLRSKAMELVARGRQMADRYYWLDRLQILEVILADLDRFLKQWVTPKLSVGPSARNNWSLDPATAEEIRRRIASLPRQPANGPLNAPKR